MTAPWISAVLCVAFSAADPSAAGPPTSGPAPAEPRPAPSTTALAKVRISATGRRVWYSYRTAWAGRNMATQGRADRQLVAAVLKGPFDDLAPLRALMAAAYRLQTRATRPDQLRCGMLASRIALTWTRRLPKDTPLKMVEIVLYERDMAEQFCLWAARALQHLAGQIPAAVKSRYGGFVPGAAVSMLSLVPRWAVAIDRPGDLGKRLLELRPQLTALAEFASDRKAGLLTEIDEHYKALGPLAKLQADKQQIRKLIAGFRQAYNDRSDKAMAALWPAGHPMTRPSTTQPMAGRIPPTHWTIHTFEPIGTYLKGGAALIRVAARYRSKAGKLGPPVYQKYNAKRTKVGWRLY